MTDGLILLPGAGHRIEGAGMTLKVGADRSRSWSMFEAEVQPGFDVGAHRHREAEEVFYILDGELDLLAFEPCDSAAADWRSWRCRMVRTRSEEHTSELQSPCNLVCR